MIPGASCAPPAPSLRPCFVFGAALMHARRPHCARVSYLAHVDPPVTEAAGDSWSLLRPPCALSAPVFRIWICSGAALMPIWPLPCALGVAYRPSLSGLSLLPACPLLIYCKLPYNLLCCLLAAYLSPPHLR